MTLHIPSLILQQELPRCGSAMLMRSILAKAPHFWSLLGVAGPRTAGEDELHQSVSTGVLV